MNAIDLLPEPAPAIPNPSAPAPAPAPAEPPAEETGDLCRGNGKVARLPKATRDQINHWLQEGLSYPDIIEKLGEPGKDLTPNNLSQWKKRGYQNWLLEQSWLEQTRARQESALDLAADFDATQVNHAALQLASLNILEALRDLKSANLDERLGGSSAAFARLLNALCRASRETMQLQKYREACAQARAQMQPLKDPHRKLTEEETRAIVRKVDQILGFASPDDPPPAPPPTPSTQIKADQACHELAAAAAPSSKFKVQSSTFEVQGSPAHPRPLTPPSAQDPVSPPIKPDQAPTATSELSTSGSGAQRRPDSSGNSQLSTNSPLPAPNSELNPLGTQTPSEEELRRREAEKKTILYHAFW